MTTPRTGRLAAAVFAALMIALGSVPLAAQNCTTAAGIPQSCSPSALTFSFTARRTLNATFTPTVVNFGNPTANDYNQGFTEAAPQVISISANSAWTLTLRSSATNWTAVGTGARAAKPRTDLLWSVGGSFVSVPGTTAATSVSLGSGSATDATIINLTYRVNWSWTLDTPGQYTIALIYLFTAP
jgi:hypothetical protein